LAMQSACLLLTGSRFGLVGILAGGLCLAVLVYRARPLSGSVRSRTYGLVTICALAAIAGARPILHRLAGSQTESYSGGFRTLTWKGTTEMAMHNPMIGTGIGSFSTAYPPFAQVGFTEHAHNSYLQIAAESGIPGLVFLVAAVFGVLNIGLRRPTQAQPEA